VLRALSFQPLFPQQAAKVGINLIVLDDGWFGKRADDSSSLGDWVADLAKFPLGMKGAVLGLICVPLSPFTGIIHLLHAGLADEVNAAGCKFGIWFEPEMVSEDSVSVRNCIFNSGSSLTLTIYTGSLRLAPGLVPARAWAAPAAGPQPDGAGPIPPRGGHLLVQHPLRGPRQVQICVAVAVPVRNCI